MNNKEAVVILEQIDNIPLSQAIAIDKGIDALKRIDLIEKLSIEAIDAKIQEALTYWNSKDEDNYNREKMRIYGMIDILSIITGKKYYFNEYGIHERI